MARVHKMFQDFYYKKIITNEDGKTLIEIIEIIDVSHFERPIVIIDAFDEFLEKKKNDRGQCE